ncbi:MAG: FtsW/RodA/SpoVE family cell cycle protein [Kiritimatiellae bacterium]|nr:FtsW/RodA/SpoVE family cell cycle protein [Kiritimatiellia bacterium]
MKKDVSSCWLPAMVVALAAMGCWFCWHCPSRYYAPEWHLLFWRQLAFNGIGFAVFWGAVRFGWRRWLAVAPWLMGLWLLAFLAAHVAFMPAHGAHKWISIGPLRVNVAKCFLPVFALFAAWLHGKWKIRPWMEWTALVVVALAVAGLSASPGLMKRLAAYFHPGGYMYGEAYMSRQLHAAFAAANWFGCAGRDLAFLPCPESDGMMSSSALLFGKWFPAAVTMLFAGFACALAMVCRVVPDKSRRRFALLFGLWFVAPAAYCLLQSLSLLPVCGVTPALVGHGGTAVVMAWFGLGVLEAMVKDGGDVSGHSPVPGGRASCAFACGAWGALAVGCVLLIALASGRAGELPAFGEPRPSVMEFGDFGLQARRGRIYASDMSPLAYSVRAWSYHLDPAISRREGHDFVNSTTQVALGLCLPLAAVETAFREKRSRYVFLREAEEAHRANVNYDEHASWFASSGVIREPVQRRVYPLGAAAAAVVGYMCESADGKPRGAAGLESAYDGCLSGTDGVYDEKLPKGERMYKAYPTGGLDVYTTIVPDVQRAVAEALAAACATNGAKSAWGIVMQVPSGKIAAMASWPSFDPSARRLQGRWNPELAVNHAAQDCFEPGGLAKPITYAIALDNGILTGESKLDQEDGVWECNGEASRVGRLHEGLGEFGFGRRTCGDTISGESAGILSGKAEHWDQTTAMRAGMGFGFAATGLQIAQAYATLANHGRMVRTRLVVVASSDDTDVGLDEFVDKPMPQVVSTAAADAVVRMLGNGMPSTIQMHDGGNSSSTNYIASCAGVCPAERPAYVVAVSFEAPRPAYTGEEVAKPVFREIADGLSK